jgi:hypothetical protein
LDNNKLSDNGAKSLSLALPHMRLVELNVGFNEIRQEGLLSIIGSITNGKTIVTLVLSGNFIDDISAKALANLLLINTALQTVLLDRTNLSSLGERFIGTGVASNRLSSLKTLTGFEFGKVLYLLGSPDLVCDMSNDQALQYLTQMWKHVEKMKNTDQTPVHHSHQNHHQPQSRQSAPSNVHSSPVPSSKSDEKKSSRKSLDKLKISSTNLRKVIAVDEQVIVNARNVKDIPFCGEELSELYQYYFRPPTNMGRKQLSEGNQSSLSLKESISQGNDLTHHRPRFDTCDRPMKRQVNKFTVAPINNYPVVKVTPFSFHSCFPASSAKLCIFYFSFSTYLKNVE